LGVHVRFATRAIVARSTSFEGERNGRDPNGERERSGVSAQHARHMILASMTMRKPCAVQVIAIHHGSRATWWRPRHGGGGRGTLCTNEED
jgi:hypothetical protein